MSETLSPLHYDDVSAKLQRKYGEMSLIKVESKQEILMIITIAKQSRY